MNKKSELPINIRVEKAKTQLRKEILKICSDYDLPGSIVGLIIESVLSKEYAEQLSHISSQISIDETEEENGNKE